MQLFSGEFVLLSVLLFFAFRLKAKYQLTERLLRGLHIYYPATADQMKKNPADHFTVLTVDDSFSTKSPYFPEVDFLLLFTSVTFALSLISFGLNGNGIVEIEQNLSFFLLLGVISLCTVGLYSHMTKSGTLNPDNYMAFMLTLTVFSLSSILLTIEHSAFLDFNFVLSTKLLNKRLTYVLQHFFNSSVNFDYSIFVISLVACISLAMLPYFRFIIRQNLNITISEGIDKAKAWKKLNLFMCTTPFLLMSLWIKPLTKNHVVPEYLAEGDYEYLRLGLVVAVVGSRLVLLRKDVQRFLNQTYEIIETALKQPTPDSIKTSTYKVKALASYGWSYTHQGLCNYIVALTICAMLLYKVDLTTPYPKPLKEAMDLPPLEVDTEEFLVSESFNAQASLIMPSRTKFYYPELRDIEILIQQAAKTRINDKTEKDFRAYMQLLGEVNHKGIISEVFYRDLLEFALWQHCLVWAFGTTFTVLYSRKFASKAKAKVG